jgi:hypothetical protein
MALHASILILLKLLNIDFNADPDPQPRHYWHFSLLDCFTLGQEFFFIFCFVFQQNWEEEAPLYNLDNQVG